METGIYIPSTVLSEQKQNNQDKTALQLVLQNCSDPIVRHRLGLFDKYFDQLVSKYGIPDKVRLEFIRENFMGKEAIKELNKAQRKNEKRNKKG